MYAVPTSGSPLCLRVNYRPIFASEFIVDTFALSSNQKPPFPNTRPVPTCSLARWRAASTVTTITTSLEFWPPSVHGFGPCFN
ncbi:unnamed protein product, partial [Protopolystoma xenopodis]